MSGPTAEQQKQWENDGYLVIEGAIAGEQLTRLQSAFDRWADECREGWLQQIARGEKADVVRHSRSVRKGRRLHRPCVALHAQ